MDDMLNNSIVVLMQKTSAQDVRYFLTVCVEAGSISEGLRLIATAKPHIAIVDMETEGDSAIELIKNIKAASPQAAVIVRSLHDELLSGERAPLAGARTDIKARKPIKNGLHAIHVSERIAMTMATKVMERNAPATDSEVEQLSIRELEVFQLLGCGYSTRQIAKKMHVSFKTVHSFRGRIKEKLKLSCPTEVLREALRWHERHNLDYAPQTN
jgi:DNA-binding NarL/FixJ family response regulator